MDERIDLVYSLLDDQIVDVDGRRCGRVDDVELVGEAGGPLRLDGLLTGRGAYPDRLPRRLRRMARTLFGDDVRGKTTHRVPWSAVDRLGVVVQLLVKAQELELAKRERDLEPEIDNLPGG
jgi:sporulation protein YlmC with PRC-barrel domain